MGNDLIFTLPGGHSGEAIPVPIPNTEVKLSYADDTALQRESRKLQGFFYFKLKIDFLKLHFSPYHHSSLFEEKTTVAMISTGTKNLLPIAASFTG